MAELNDIDLISRTAAGDRQAFTLLLRRHLGGVRQYLFSMSHNMATAEDLSQETFLKLWQRAYSFDSEQGAATTWLYKIAHNQFIDYARKPVTRFETTNADLPEPSTVAEDQVVNTKELAWLRAQLQDLPLTQRSAVALRFLQGYSNRECAHILGTSEDAVESLLSRAKTSLRSVLASDQNTRDNHERE